ncbi:chromogranin A, isoform CRA_e [Rattus norvegicus]|uniref:Chromogranin A, isoform CRA_e n=1 Tax=Rattus norvegicus TaxID=10116 RepID=A6JEK8_RAT|nr:chromogranin A, isoform CRA_e [Rattus norvegicus]
MRSSAALALLLCAGQVFALPVNSPMTKGDTKVRRNVGVSWEREGALWTPHGQSLGNCRKEPGMEPKGSTAAAEPAQGTARTRRHQRSPAVQLQ